MSKMDKGMSLLTQVGLGLKADKTDLDELQQKLETTHTVLAEVRVYGRGNTQGTTE